MLDKAFPCDAENAEDDDEDETLKKRAPKSEGTKKSRKSEVEEDEDWEEVIEEEDDEDVIDYSDMSAKELYELCKERGIKVPPKKPAKFYINELEEFDKAQDDWSEEDEDEEDDWGDE